MIGHRRTDATAYGTDLDVNVVLTGMNAAKLVVRLSRVGMLDACEYAPSIS